MRLCFLVTDQRLGIIWQVNNKQSDQKDLIQSNLFVWCVSLHFITR